MSYLNWKKYYLFWPMYWITLNFHYLLINENRYCLQMAPVVRPVSLQIIATSSKCQRI